MTNVYGVAGLSFKLNRREMKSHALCSDLLAETCGVSSWRLAYPALFRDAITRIVSGIVPAYSSAVVNGPQLRLAETEGPLFYCQSIAVNPVRHWPCVLSRNGSKWRRLGRCILQMAARMWALNSNSSTGWWVTAQWWKCELMTSLEGIWRLLVGGGPSLMYSGDEADGLNVPIVIPVTVSSNLPFVTLLPVCWHRQWWHHCDDASEGCEAVPDHSIEVS